MNRNITLYDWLNIWLNNYAKYLVKISTFVSYEGYINNHFIEIGDITLNNLSLSDLQIFFNRKTNYLSVKTVRNMLSFIKKALNQAEKENIIEKNIAKEVELPRYKGKKIRVLEKEEREKIYEKSYYYDYGIYVRIALNTGIRLGEMLGLKWEDIDLEKGKIKIERTLNRLKNYEESGGKTKIYIQNPKTENSIREIPIGNKIVKELRELKEMQRKNGIKLEYVATKRDGKYIEPRVLQEEYRIMMKEMEIEGVTFHGLRHTFATTALERGMDIKVLSEIMGHSSVTFTLNTYTQVLYRHKKESMKLIEEVYKVKEIEEKDKEEVIKIKKYKDMYIMKWGEREENKMVIKKEEEIKDMLEYIIKRI